MYLKICQSITFFLDACVWLQQGLVGCIVFLIAAASYFIFILPVYEVFCLRIYYPTGFCFRLSAKFSSLTNQRKLTNVMEKMYRRMFCTVDTCSLCHCFGRCCVCAHFENTIRRYRNILTRFYRMWAIVFVLTP